MAWSTPLTAVSNVALTAAQWNASVRDNLLETSPGKAGASENRHFVRTAANTIAERVCQGAKVTGAGQSTSNTGSYVDLTTVGPTISSAPTGTRAMVAVTAYISNDTAGSGGYMSYAVTGSSAIAASDDWAARYHVDVANRRVRFGAVMYDSSLTAGTNTFECKYKALTSGSADFDERDLFVLGIN